MTGKGIDKTKTVSVGELNVAFCCNGCKSKTEGKKDKAEFIFANDVFDKTFFSILSCIIFLSSSSKLSGLESSSILFLLAASSIKSN